MDSDDFPFPRPSPRAVQSSSTAGGASSAVGAVSNNASSIPRLHHRGLEEATAPSSAFALGATETEEGKTPGTKLRLEWQVVFAGDLEGLHHQRPSCTVVLVHAVLASRRSIFVDGEKVFDEAKQLKGKPFRHELSLRGHDFCIDIRAEVSAGGTMTPSSNDELLFERSLSVDGTAFSLLPTIDQLIHESNLQAERVAQTASGVAVAITDYFRDREGLLIHCRTERRPTGNDSRAAEVPQLPSLSPQATSEGFDSSRKRLTSDLALGNTEPELQVEVAFRREAIETLLRVIHHRIQEAEAVTRPHQELEGGDSLQGPYSFEAACIQLERTTRQVVEATLLEMQRADPTLCSVGDSALEAGGDSRVTKTPAKQSQSAQNFQDTSSAAVLESQLRGWNLQFVFLSDAQNRERAKNVQCLGIAKRFGTPLFYEVAAEHGVGEDIAGPGGGVYMSDLVAKVRRKLVLLQEPPVPEICRQVCRQVVAVFQTFTRKIIRLPELVSLIERACRSSRKDEIGGSGGSGGKFGIGAGQEYGKSEWQLKQERRKTAGQRSMLQVFEDALRMYRGWFDEHNDNGGDDTSVKPFADLDPVELQDWVSETFGGTTKFGQILKHSQLSALDLHDMPTADLLQLAQLVDEASASKIVAAIEKAKKNGVLVATTSSM